MTGDLDPARRLYAEPDARELLASIPALAERIHASLVALQGDPSPARCADLVQTLYGTQTHIQRPRTAIERDA